MSLLLAAGGTAFDHTGTLNVSLADVTLAATAVLPIGANTAVTLSDVTLASTGAVPIRSNTAVTLEAVTLVASGQLPILAALDIVLAGLTMTAPSEITGGATPESPTGGWAERPHARDYDFLESAEIKRRRASERERLKITEPDQRRLDRTAKKIARTLPRQGLNVAPASVMAEPAFDALLMALRPSEGEVMALAQAVVQRVLFLAEVVRQEEEDEVVAWLMGAM